MSEPYSESDLLAWLEDELDPARREVLERILAADPAALRVLRQMREDRELLRSAGSPELPRDLVADLEPQLSRPMLIEHEPGHYRRNVRGRSRGRRLSPGRLALAAVFLLAVIAGVWAIAVGLPGWRDALAPEWIANADTAAARNPGAAMPSAPGTTEGTAGASLGSPAAAPSAPGPGSIVHHRRPLRRVLGSGPAMLGADGADPSRDRAPARAAFAIVVRADDPGSIGESMAGVVRAWLETEAGPETAALVRNFSFDEADRLLAQLRRDPRRTGAAPDALADVSGSGADRGQETAAERRRRMADLLRELRRHDDASAPERPTSGRLAGSDDLEPSYEHQLEFSNLGAEFTLTVPADRLNELLVSFRSIEGISTSLRAWRRGGRWRSGGDDRAPRWIEEQRALQAMVVGGSGDGYLLVPVIVESDDR